VWIDAGIHFTQRTGAYIHNCRQSWLPCNAIRPPLGCMERVCCCERHMTVSFWNGQLRGAQE
jgi:hypothetical protein